LGDVGDGIVEHPTGLLGPDYASAARCHPAILGLVAKQECIPVSLPSKLKGLRQEGQSHSLKVRC
jgi:hypothetical protein